MTKLFHLFILLTLPMALFAEGLQHLSTQDLLRQYVMIQDELKSRRISNSGNNLTGELGEHLFVKAFDWERASRSRAGYDATSKVNAKRYQVKARRLSSSAGNEQLGAIRKLDGFDVLAVVLFDRNYQVVNAALIPKAVVLSHSTFNSYTNSYRFMFSASVRGRDDVQDVTDKLRSVDY